MSILSAVKQNMLTARLTELKKKIDFYIKIRCHLESCKLQIRYLEVQNDFSGARM
jgi:hypothetical protein